MENAELERQIRQVYDSQDNFRIWDTDCKNGVAVIYFSSNAVWYLGEPETFVSHIVERDRYEFSTLHLQKAERHIFVRDVYINWYFRGINRQIDSIDKLREKLAELTQGYRVITLGCSGGGYMAMLMGAWLRADYVLSFSGQIDVLKFAQNVDYRFPFCDVRSESVRKYLNIQKILDENPVCIFNFVATKSAVDKENIELSLGTKCIHTFLMATNKHGMPITKKFLSYYLNLSKTQWLQIYEKVEGKAISPKRFDFINISISSLIKLYIKYRANKLVRKYLK